MTQEGNLEARHGDGLTEAAHRVLKGGADNLLAVGRGKVVKLCNRDTMAPGRGWILLNSFQYLDRRRKRFACRMAWKVLVHDGSKVRNRSLGKRFGRRGEEYANGRAPGRPRKSAWADPRQDSRPGRRQRRNARRNPAAVRNPSALTIGTRISCKSAMKRWRSATSGMIRLSATA